jgi:hypothetical protein
LNTHLLHLLTYLFHQAATFAVTHLPPSVKQPLLLPDLVTVPISVLCSCSYYLSNQAVSLHLRFGIFQRQERKLSKYQVQPEAPSNDDFYFPDVHQRLYLAKVYSLYNQETRARRRNARQRKRGRQKAAHGHKAASRSLHDIFVGFLLLQMQNKDSTRQNAKERFENWMSLGRICAKLVESFGAGILLLILRDLSNET